MSSEVNTVPFRLSLKATIVLLILVGAGFLSLKLLFLENEGRAWTNFLMGSSLFLGLGLCGLFFTAIQHLTKARWSVGPRRVLEAMTLTLPVAAVLFFFVFKGANHLYEWAHVEKVAEDHLLQWKSGFLNASAFGTRLIIYFIVWILSGAWMVCSSLGQDKSGNVNTTEKNRKRSALVLIGFALTTTMAGFDILMSIEPHWFSTIFGIYFFAGLFQAGLAMFFILTFLAYRAGALKDVITVDHFHDISRFVFGFSIFWAYIAFSQFMLIWYGNMPEETFFYDERMKGGWQWIGLALLIVRFVAPFLILMPYGMKRKFKVMLPMCFLVLFGEWLDLYWIAMPARRLMDEGVQTVALFGWKEIGIGIGFVSLFLLIVTMIMARIRMVPVNDPRLEASIHYYHHG